MDNKLSELSKPVAWVLGTPSCKHLTADAEYADWYLEHGSTAAPLYSQEYVSALLAELETKDKRIAELEDAEQKLCAANVTLDARASEAEAKLATPVRLSQRYETAGYCIDEHYCQEADGGDYLDRDELIASLREQGFTVEGDE